MKKRCNHNEMVWAGDTWKCALCGYIYYDSPEHEINRLRTENERLREALADCILALNAGNPGSGIRYETTKQRNTHYTEVIGKARAALEDKTP